GAEGSVTAGAAVLHEEELAHVRVADPRDVRVEYRLAGVAVRGRGRGAREALAQRVVRRAGGRRDLVAEARVVALEVAGGPCKQLGTIAGGGLRRGRPHA